MILSSIQYLLPWKIDRVAVGHDLDDLAVDRDAIIGRLHIGLKNAQGGVVLEEVGGLLDTTSVVNGDDVKRGVFATVPAPQEVSSDSSKPIYSHL